MSARTRRRLVSSLVVVGVALGSSLVVYSVLVMALGVNQPLLLVPSRSMEPTIDAGDVISMRAISAPQIHLGDVIIYQQTGTGALLIHRVVCIVTTTNSQCVGSLYVYMKCSSSLLLYEG